MDGGQGAATGPGGLAQPLPLELLGQAVAVVDTLVAAVDDAAWLSDSQSLDLVRGLSRLQALVGAGYLGAVRDLDSRPEAVEGAREGKVAQTFLSVGLRVGPRRAAADVRAARALDTTGLSRDGREESAAADAAATAAGEEPARDPVDPVAVLASRWGDGVLLDGQGDPVLPCLAASFAAGRVSREHVDVVVGAVRSLPRALLRRFDPDGVNLAARADALMTDQAEQVDVETLRDVAKALRAYLDPDNETFDADAYEQRSLSWKNGPDGTIIGRFQLPGAQGAAFVAAIDALAAPDPAAEATDQAGDPVLVRDRRTLQQRRADALTGLSRHAASCPGLAVPGSAAPAGDPSHSGGRGDSGGTGSTGGSGSRAMVMVITDLDQVAAAHAARQHAADQQDRARPHTRPRSGAPPRAPAPGAPGARGTPAPESAAPAGRGPGWARCMQTGAISPTTLAVLSCDAVLQSVVLDRSGAVLALGRQVRTASAAQRRALAARDRGCVIPGCRMPVERTDAHHIRWWSHGGETDLENLALLCGRHHDEVHAGIWTLQMIGGVCWAVPPAWMTPGRPLLRNTAHHTGDTARTIAIQLTLPDPPAAAAS